MKCVIDSDQLIYAAGFACKDEPLSHACQMVKKGIEKILQDTGCSDFQLYIGGTGNFREEVAVTQGYKANRTAPRPDHYDGIRDYMKGVWGAEEVDGMEVDDKVSMLLYEDYAKLQGKDGAQIILSSPDKDLNNTMGWHYNPRTRKKYWVTEEQADRHFHYQLLTGDTVDNIKGLPHGTESFITRYGCSSACKKGIGPATAKKIMESEDYQREVYRCYFEWAEANMIDNDDLMTYMTEQGQLLWMLREEDELGPLMWRPNEKLFDELAGEYND